MSAHHSDPSDLIPVSLLTGFLGSGKTTVLNHLLRQEALAKAVVIINEFGEIGLDHELVVATTENLVLLQSGCLCCTIRGDLVQTLRALLKKRASGDVAPFDRVVIETTGLADPAPILHTLMMDRLLSDNFRLDGVIVTVDAATGSATLDSQIESVKQVAVADRILLAKTDMVAPVEVRSLEARVRALNPAAPIIRVHNGAVEAGRLLDAGLYDPKTKSLDVQKWLNAEAYIAAGDHDRDHHHDHDHHHRSGHDAHHQAHGHHHGDAGHDHHHDVNRHDDRISAVAFTLDEPIPPAVFDVWVDALMMIKGPNILRMKAMVNIQGLGSPLVLHGVQHIFHPPIVLPNWPSDDRRSRIVVIGRDLTDDFLDECFAFLKRADRKGARKAARGRDLRAA